MRKIFFGLISFLLSVAIAQANELQKTNDTNKDNQNAYLKFTPEFLQAVENCQAYLEDVTLNNPILAEQTGDAELKQQILMQVHGWDDDLCHFTIDYRFKQDEQFLARGMRENCHIDKDNLFELAEAMKDTSGEAYEETIDNQQISGSRFDVTYAKIKSMLCQQEDIEVDEAEQAAENSNNDGDIEEELTPEEFAEKYNLFSPQFMMSLQSCTPNQEIREISHYKYTIKIIGKQLERCKLKYGQFDLQVPMEIISSIHGFDDVKTLLKNSDIAYFNYQPEYFYEGLVHAYNACHNKHSYYSLKKVKRINEVTISKGMNAEYDGKACIINLSNDVEYDGKVMDYGVMCRLTNETIDELWPIFKETLEKYGERKVKGINNEKRILQGANNKETKDADIALMYYMQQQEYCRKPVTH